jgi:hypothetical protein
VIIYTKKSIGGGVDGANENNKTVGPSESNVTEETSKTSKTV